MDIEHELSTLRALFEAAPLGLLVTDPEGTIVWSNRETARIFDYEVEDLLGKRIEHLVPENGRASHVAAREAFHRQKPRHVMGKGRDVHGRKRDGSSLPLEVGLADVVVNDTTLAVAALADITTRKRAEEEVRRLLAEVERVNCQLEQAAHTDPLTGLLNRRGFDRALEREHCCQRRLRTRVVAVLIDCDDFKAINDSLGYSVGDAVLCSLTRAISDCVRPGDSVARIGGDEFLLLLPDTREAEAALVAERVRLAAATSQLPIEQCRAASVTISVAYAEVPLQLSSTEELLILLHKRLHLGKAAGKNQIVGDGANWRNSRPSTAEKLLASTHIYSVVQPIFSLCDSQSVAMEMLSRSRLSHCETPDHFFQIAREENFSTALDLHCLRTCIASADTLPSTGLHLNILPSTLISTCCDRLVELLASSDSRHQICLEISEQQFIGDPGCLVATITELRQTGIQIAIDDVGFGRSSLETLIVLEPNIVKIDQRYVRGAAQNKTQRQALRRLVNVINSLGTKIVAEGVETREEIDVLCDMGVLFGQGFFWGQPQPLSQEAPALVGA